ncbi:hypothetical protein VHEMI06505 [[Torrubiella] hemipterigena]|uniref:DUF1746 domain-containing protein n=1 Tax=[Torrubiella] hemipterigena TaxID=1531966 RepID=A0A0A1T7H8_9HYPO|nr:hypothetical protein VHEMI06505 [[Torrubiella] hemipterigena]
MSDGPLTSTAARYQGGRGPSNADDGIRALSQARLARARRKDKLRHNPGLKKKLAFVTHLLKSLDLLVFAELSAMYYMECSIILLLLRAAGQYIYLSPKDEAFPFLMPASRVQVLFVAIPNIICIFSHLFYPLPKGPDYHRGYQHGGLIIDFVGQNPPKSRTYYLLADLLLLALQCLMLTIHSDREKLRLHLKTFKPLLPDLAQDVTAGRTLEDLDAEERGVVASRMGPEGETETDIELQPLNPSSGETGDDTRTGAQGRSRQEEEGEDGTNTRTHLSDIMNSGNGLLGEYHVIHSVKHATSYIPRNAAQAFQNLSYSSTLAALQARRRGGS